MTKIFYDSWESSLRILIITVLAYIVLIIFLRISGKRTLSKMNAFDFIVTIALGSTLATVILSKDVALADGIFAFFLLIFLQYIITWLSARNQRINELVKSSPTLLAYQGKLLKGMMLKERISEDEVYAIIRKNGFSKLEETSAVVLETDGSLSVIKKTDSLDSSVFSKVQKEI